MGDNTMLISHDVVRRDILQVEDNAGNSSIELMKQMALYGKNIGYNVILEGILSTHKYGEMLRDLTDEFKGNIHAYYMDISLDETLRRRSLKPDSHEFSNEKMRQWWRENDRLNIDIEEIITEDMKVDNIIQLILADVREQ